MSTVPEVPEALLKAFEQFYLNITQDLDPYFSLALTNLSKQTITTAYLMGFQDAQKCVYQEKSPLLG